MHLLILLFRNYAVPFPLAIVEAVLAIAVVRAVIAPGFSLVTVTRCRRGFMYAFQAVQIRLLQIRQGLIKQRLRFLQLRRHAVNLPGSHLADRPSV